MTRRSSAALTTRSRVITPVAMLILSPLLTTAPALDAHGLTAKVDYPSPGCEVLDFVGETREGALCRGASSRGGRFSPAPDHGRSQLSAGGAPLGPPLPPSCVAGALPPPGDRRWGHDPRGPG